MTYVIGLKRYQAGAVDRYNKPTDSWLAAVDIEVYAIAPKSSDEPFEVGRDAVVTGLQVLAPAGTVIGRKDRIVFEGEEYTVEGEIADWTYSPYHTGLLEDAGIEVNLKRVEG